MAIITLDSCITLTSLQCRDQTARTAMAALLHHALTQSESECSLLLPMASPCLTNLELDSMLFANSKFTICVPTSLMWFSMASSRPIQEQSTVSVATTLSSISTMARMIQLLIITSTMSNVKIVTLTAI